MNRESLDTTKLTAVVRSRQLHIYRNGKKVLVLIGIYQNTEIWQHFFKESIRLS